MILFEVRATLDRPLTADEIAAFGPLTEPAPPDRRPVGQLVAMVSAAGIIQAVTMVGDLIRVVVGDGHIRDIHAAIVRD